MLRLGDLEPILRQPVLGDQLSGLAPIVDHLRDLDDLLHLVDSGAVLDEVLPELIDVVECHIIRECVLPDEQFPLAPAALVQPSGGGAVAKELDP